MMPYGLAACAMVPLRESRIKGEGADIPLVFIPTAYNDFTDTELHEKGADMIIYANHLMRSAYAAMEKTAASILRNGKSSYADEHYCIPVKEILNLFDGEQE